MGESESVLTVICMKE